MTSDFAPHVAQNPKSKNEFVEHNIAPPLLYFAPKIRILGQEVLESHADINKMHRLTERESRLAHYFALYFGVWGYV